MAFRVRLTETRVLHWATHPCILYPVCDTLWAVIVSLMHNTKNLAFAQGTRGHFTESLTWPTLSLTFFPHIGSIWRSSNTSSLWEGPSIQEEVINANISEPLPCGRHLLAPLSWNRRTWIYWKSGLGQHQVDSSPTCSVHRWTAVFYTNDGTPLRFLTDGCLARLS